MVKQEAENYLVLGLGMSGRSTIRYLINEGAKVIGFDDKLTIDDELNTYVKQGALFFSNEQPNLLDNVKYLVKSPGIPETHSLVQKAKSLSIPVIGDIELVAKRMDSVPCIGITGTNGKTTVSLLIGHILQTSGRQFKVCGNVGVPITDVVMDGPFEGLVIELSSYQLETLSTPFLDKAVLLNVTPDHLDRYATFEEYRDTKFRIFSLLKENGCGFAHKSMAQYAGKGVIIYGNDQRLPKVVRENYRSHDLENIEAAYCVCRDFGLSDDDFVNALFTFKKPPHRIELVRRAGGVSFYNDSKGTNIDAVEKAVQAMQGDVVLIAGGVDKGASYISWKQSFSGKVKKICAIGEAAPKMVRELGCDFSIETFDGLQEAVAHAIEVSKPGENVLLSPGCASFDMFRDYQHRGDEFKRIVRLITVGE